MPLRSLRFLALAPALVSSAFAVTLSGVQKDAAFTLPKGSHALKGDYVVPAGKKLVIEAGATVAVEKGAGLSVQGELAVAGTLSTPVIFRGKDWKGIRVAEGAKGTVSGLQVTGAATGLRVEGSIDAIKASVFSKNTLGLKLDGQGSVIVENCLFSDNGGDGLRITGGMKGAISGSSFLKNKRFGATVGESSPSFDKCLFCDNGTAGIEQSNASSATGMRGTGCSFEGKGVSLQSAMSHGSLEFPKCFWGEKSVPVLKSQGEGVAVPNLKDARSGSGSLKVYLHDFLSAAPKPCGATVTSRL